MAHGRRGLSEISLGWLTVPKASPLEVIEAAADAGFGAVSLRVAGRTVEDDPGLADDASALAEIAAALKGNGVRLLHMGGVWLDGSRPIAGFDAALAAGARLGAAMCVAVATLDRTASQVHDDFAQLCRRAAAHGIRVAIEFAAYLGVRSLEEANALVEHSGEPNAGLLVDALHLFRSGGTVGIPNR